MPVAVATSFFFNRFLVPRYLLTGLKWKFSLYLCYLIIVSIYLELLVMILAFVILADYQVANLGKIAGDIYLLTIILYFIVFIDGLILSLQNLKEKERQLADTTNTLRKEREVEVSIRVDRKSVNLILSEILFIESMSDYVQVYTKDKKFTTKEKISSFHDRLPSAFIRIHRSYLVNKVNVDSFNKEFVFLAEHKLPIGRKYRPDAERELNSEVIV